MGSWGTNRIPRNSPSWGQAPKPGYAAPADSRFPQPPPSLSGSLHAAVRAGVAPPANESRLPVAIRMHKAISFRSGLRGKVVLRPCCVLSGLANLGMSYWAISSLPLGLAPFSLPQIVEAQGGKKNNTADTGNMQSTSEVSLEMSSRGNLKSCHVIWDKGNKALT